MNYIDEYRDRAIAAGLIEGIARMAANIGRPVTIMEICGSHTHALSRFGIRHLLPDTVRLISGPGCPVCVTSAQDVDLALHLARQPGIIFATFGDMLRVPGTGGVSLQKLRACGSDVRVIASPRDAVTLAEEYEDKEVILMGVGFETTAPAIASIAVSARERALRNFSILSAHKTVPPAIAVLVNDPLLRVDGFICPGHVSTIIGAEAYLAIPAAGKAAVITGFEPLDLLEGIHMILGQCLENCYQVAIQYRRGVNKEGNQRARRVMMDVFVEQDAGWRGLGIIPRSGLAFRDTYRTVDARHRYVVPSFDSREPEGCACGEILRGLKTPESCPLFRTVCSPPNPIGPCMVSSEGTCAAYYNYM